ncbi:MAG: saccharopine dehydrogenase [Rhodococcus sp.]|nr:saccharopine dehydrogenase [Rhodococcus sp. (in: high G+C Gram-positive bacteria)]
MDDTLQLNADGPVLIVGGYGTVGAELARLAAPEWPLLLTGRTPEKGQPLARELGAKVARWDLDDPQPFQANVRAVVSAVNDPDDRVLRAAASAGIPYVDITRWTVRLTRAVAAAAVARPAAPVLLSSAWMGGITSLVAAALAHEIGGASQVDIAIRYDLDDRAGADSVEFMDRLGLNFEVVDEGQQKLVMPLSDIGTVAIGEDHTKVARIDTPEQFTLPLTLGVHTARTRIGFSARSSTYALLAAHKLGVFRWGRGERWTGLRRSMLYSPGEGGSARIRIEVRGDHGSRSVTVIDPAGQAHLTAVGGLLGLRRVLGVDVTPAPPGVSFPEQTDRPQDVITWLEKAEIQVERA